MLTQADWLVHLEHYKDLLRKAEQKRLARLALSALPANKTEKKMEIRKDVQLVETPEIACCVA